MKTIEKKAPISKALAEVWEWKEETFNDVKDMCFENARGLRRQRHWIPDRGFRE